MSQGISSTSVVLSNIIKGTYSGSLSKSVKVDESGSLFSIPEGRVSVLNTSLIPLNSGDSFTGSSEFNTLPDVMVSCKTDKSSSLYFDFSNDNVNWDTFPSNGFSVAPNIHESHNAVKGTRYFRVRVVNVSVENQSYLRLYTHFGTYKHGNLPLNQSVTSDADAIITRGVLVGETDGRRFINVPVTSEGHLETAIHSPRLPFGSVHCERLSPVFQVDAVYGLDNGEISYGSSLSGVASASSSMFSVATGNTIYSQAFIQSRRRLRYRPGQGLVGRCTALFSPPSESSYQLVGYGHVEDGIYIGYSGSSFGILHSSFGIREQEFLSISTGSTTAQSIKVTLSGVTSSVLVSNSSNSARTAYEISQGTFDGWSAECTNSGVLFVADAVGLKSDTFSATGSGGFSGSFTKLKLGQATTETFVSQSSWNADKFDGVGNSGASLNPQLGNVFQFNIQYLGFGPVAVMAETSPDNGNNSDFVTLHSFGFPNQRNKPSFGNPSFPFTMAVYSAGSTGNLVTKAGCFAGFIEGEKVNTGNRFSYRNNIAAASTTVWTPIFTVQNSNSYGGRSNQSIINILSLGYGCNLSANAAGEFALIKNGILSGSSAPFFSRFDDGSCSLFDTASTVVTYSKNSQIVFSLPVADDTQDTFTFSEVIDIQPGESLTVACKLIAGSATFVNASINTKEDQ